MEALQGLGPDIPKSQRGWGVGAPAPGCSTPILLGGPRFQAAWRDRRQPGFLDLQTCKRDFLGATRM